MIRLAVPTRNNVVDDHFGHCESYTLVTIKDNKIEDTETIPSPQGCGCKSNIAGVLQEKGVQVMLAGSIGMGALNVLNMHGIKVYRGCSGDINELVHHFMEGRIQDSGMGCQHHGEDHQCNH